jgi:phospholipase C
MSPGRAHAMDHVVLVLFENRSTDNLLGHLYGPRPCQIGRGVAAAIRPHQTDRECWDDKSGSGGGQTLVRHRIDIRG